jgi:hypothetical protein|nr:MAG TPA: Lysin motif [Caudoviricetes sp.]
MINNGFYNYHNLKEEYLGGKVQHYPIKDASVTLEWYEYVVKAGETLYSIAAKVFGSTMMQNWTYIADNNPPRNPDDWRMGDVLRLPKVIIRDTIVNR